MIRRGGRGLDSRANGSFPKGARRLSEKSPSPGLAHSTPHRISLRLAARLLRLPLKGGVIALGARASRPHPVPLAAVPFELQCDAAGSHPVGGNSSGQTEGEPWRRSRLIQVGEMRLCQALCGRPCQIPVPGQDSWCGRDARAPRKPSSHDIVTPRAQNCRSILVPLVVGSARAPRRSLLELQCGLGQPPFVFLRVHCGSSSLTIGRVPSCPFVVHLQTMNDPHGRAGARLNTCAALAPHLKNSPPAAQIFWKKIGYAATLFPTRLAGSGGPAILPLQPATGRSGESLRWERKMISWWGLTLEAPA